MSSKKGVSALASMVALGAIIVLVTGTTIWVENNRTTNYSSDVNSSNVIAAAEGALQDAILKLNLKNSSENYSLIINGATVGVCYYADSPSTGIYTIRVKAIKGNITRAMKALVNKDLNTLKFNIYSKEEEVDSICVVTAATVPSAPLNPIWASSASGQVTINWSAPTSNGGSSITNYKVYRGVTSGGETLLTTLGNVLTITDTGLTNNVLYYYKISAVNSVGEGSQSTEVSAIPGETPTGSVTVSNYASGDYVGATYQIVGTFTSNTSAISCDYSVNGGTNWSGAILSGTLPNYTCTKTGVSAQENVSYGITMRVTNSIGPGSAPAITKTGDATGPSIVIDWADTAWTATSPLTVTLVPTDSGAGVSTTKYCTDTSDVCNPTSGTVGLSTSFTCSTGQNCVNYIRYASWDNVNNASAIYSRRVRQDKLVPTDGILTVTPGAYQNSLSWSGFSDSGSGLATSNTYKVVFLTTGSPNATCSNGTQAYLGTATSYIHTGLTGGTTYYYRACAYDGVGNVSNGATNNGVPITTTTTTCTPNCSGKNCGDDGCGGSCGTCSTGYTCSGGTCIADCTCGSWSACSGSYSDTCDTTCDGTQTRTCSPSGCASQSQSCSCGTRSTDGTVCSSWGSCSDCSYSSTCATSATGTQTASICSGSSCSGSTSQECTCTRTTDGITCGTATYTNCGGCILNGGCTGYKICDYTTYACSSGSCVSGTDPGGGELSCTATNGAPCDTTYSSWGSCSSAVSCGAYPWKHYRTVYSWTCSSGSCILTGTCTNCENECCTPE